jgi:AraC-like DNA-binding protein
MASCRIAEVKRRLGATRDPIAKIARDLGFASPRHLTTQFRQFCGITPNSFRGNAQGGNEK